MSQGFQPKFGHAADEFQRFRPGYPAALFERILREVPPHRRNCAMDLGAGTGKVTRELLSHFAEVIAVEPDPLMVAKIREQFPRAIIRISTAEECPQAPASVDLVTIANALHWMESERVFANIRSWLRPGGILAVFDRPLPKCSPEIDAIVLGEVRGPWKPHRDPRLKRARNWQQQVRSAPGIEIVEETKFPNLVSMSPEDYVGFWRSTSYGSSYARTLADPESYWHQLESRFRAASSDGMIPVDFSPTLILARKS
jgi:SAM-dependent methyltransferase